MRPHHNLLRHILQKQNTPKPHPFSSTPTNTTTTPLIELREYHLHPAHATSYMTTTTRAAPLRKSLTPLRLFCLPDTGTDLNVATHFYYYRGGHAERDAKRGAMGGNEEWKTYLEKVRPAMARQRSRMFVEAHLGDNIDDGGNGMVGLSDCDEHRLLPSSSSSSSGGGDPVYEIRRYNLVLGYDTVPRFLEYYKSGLPSKLATTDDSTSLVTLLYSDVGRLNEVIEVWRHGDGTGAMERSRANARAAGEWRKAIGDIAALSVSFENGIYKPAEFSPLR